MSKLMEQTESIQAVVRADYPHHGLGSPRSLVCEKCWNEVFDTDAYEIICLKDDYAFEYTRSHQEIQTAALAGCNWCMFIMSELVKFSGAKDQVRVKFTGIDDPYSKIATPKGQNTYHLYVYGRSSQRELHLFAYTHATDAAAEFVTARKLQPNVSSDSAIKQCREWLSDCASSHEQCPKPAASQLPTRVIDVSPEGSSDKPRLLETRGQRGEYLTLSYCWGKRHVSFLTSRNIAAYYEQLDIAAISHTLRDAINLAKRLGFRFIWIDALCIIQDSEQDKEKELSSMNRIYRDSLLTIVASSASNVDEGFLADRSNDDLEVLVNRQLADFGIGMDESLPSSPSSTYEIPFRYGNGFMGRMFVRTDCYLGDLLEPVNRRAWTLQEQLLASRLLLFSSHTLQWRCRSRSRNLDDSLHVPLYQYGFTQPLVTEKYELTLNADDEGDGDTMQKREAAIWKNWNDILYQYSTRQVSLSDDKLVALGGVAEEFSRFIPGRYLAGLWENRLCEQLLWACPAGPCPSRPAHYRAPSWSWAAIDGPLRPGLWDLVSEPERRRTSLTAEVIECNVVLKSQILPFGAVKEGFIKLKAARRPGRLCFFEKGPMSNPEDPSGAFVIWEDNEVWKTDGHTFSQKSTLAFPRADLDALGQTSKEEVECLVVGKGSSGNTLEGLLLQRYEDGLFRRIGLFHGAEEAAFEHIKQEEVTII